MLPCPDIKRLKCVGESASGLKVLRSLEKLKILTFPRQKIQGKVNRWQQVLLSYQNVKLHCQEQDEAHAQISLLRAAARGVSARRTQCLVRVDRSASSTLVLQPMRLMTYVLQQPPAR